MENVGLFHFWRIAVIVSVMTVAAVDRAFQLLRAIRTTDGSLSGLARHTDMPVATVSRLLTTLEAAGAVQREQKAYRIGPAIRELALDEEAHYDLLSIAGPHLANLAALTNETAGVAACEGRDLHHLGQVATEHDVSVTDWTGFRVGVHSGAIGLVMMAHWPTERIDAYLAPDLEQYAERTVIDPTMIRARLEQIRTDGFIWTTDEYALGVTTVAAPILDRDGLGVGALHVHGPSFRFPAQLVPTEVEQLITDRAASISGVLGWTDHE